MSPLSDMNFDNILDYVGCTSSPHDTSKDQIDLEDFIQEERKLSQSISRQEFKDIEKHIELLHMGDLLAHPAFTGGEDTTQPSASPGNSETLDADSHNYDFFTENSSGPSGTEIDRTPHALVTFTSRGQSRTGSYHGRGGRKQESGYQVRRKYANYVESVLCKRLLTLYSMNDFHAFKVLLEKLWTDGIVRGSLPGILITYRKRFTRALSESIGHHPYTIQELPFCALGVSAKFSKSDSVSSDKERTKRSMSRHVTNTWVDCCGGLRCTCLGSTQYSILARDHGFETPCCEHTRAFLDVFDLIGKNVFVTSCLNTYSIFTTISLAVPDLVNPLSDCFPFYRYIHRNQTVIYVYGDAIEGSEMCWVPIRCVQRKGMKFLCAFCDSIPTKTSLHERFVFLDTTFSIGRH